MSGPAARSTTFTGVTGAQVPKRKRIKEGKPFCPDDIAVRADHAACLYASLKTYAYWERTRKLSTLATHRLPERGWAFAGPEWQLWLNHTLAHAEAARCGATRATFAVCAPAQNDALLGRGLLERFRARLTDPETFRFLSLDSLLEQLRVVTTGAGDASRAWGEALTARYGGI